MATPVEDIKRKVDIVDLVGETAALKASGRNFKANCPFHNERTPSFYVFPDRQSWHCFGACATGGDVFSFVMRRDGVEFGEALRALAARAGIELAPPQASREKAGRVERLKAVNRAAAMHFHETLMTAPEAKPVREYLERRGLNAQTLEDYRLGFSPQSPAALQRSLASQGFADQDLLGAGLLRAREDGSSFAFFRGRLMIPIQDARGDYLGFGARALEDGQQPKYLNSPQSDLFDKSSILYGLHRAVDAIKTERMAIIVEGYMDALMAHQYGFRNVVASMGTALTDKQVGTLKRLANVFILALDPDAAGDEATLRSLEGSWQILERPTLRAPQAARLTGPDTRQELVLKVMDLPRGMDPDDLIRENPDRWRALVATATPVVDYVFAAMASRFDITTAKGKATVVERVAPFIHNAANVFEQNELIRKLARLLNEEENTVRLAVNGPGAVGRGRDRRRGPVSQLPGPATQPTRDPVETYCLAMLLRFPELQSKTAQLTPGHFSSGPSQAIFKALASGVPSEDLKDRLGPGLESEMDALLANPLPPANYRERERGLEHCIRRLEERHVKLHLEALQSQVGENGELGLELAPMAEELNNQLQRIHGAG